MQKTDDSREEKLKSVRTNYRPWIVSQRQSYDWALPPQSGVGKIPSLQLAVARRTQLSGTTTLKITRSDQCT